MGVGLAFLRKRPDRTWEGDYQLRGRGEFGDLQDLIFSLDAPLLYLLAFREDEYDVEIDDGPPPYLAQVAESLAPDLERWSQRVGPALLEALRQVPEEKVETYVRPLKRLVEDRLAEGYAILVSY